MRGSEIRTVILINWDHLAVEGAIILVLTGVHGYSDGELERKGAENFYKEDLKHVEFIKKEKANDIQQLNMKIEALDIWAEAGNPDGSFDFEKFGEKLSQLKPTFLVLGWCHSLESEPFLDQHGVSARMILQEDRMRILGSR